LHFQEAVSHLGRQSFKPLLKSKNKKAQGPSNCHVFPLITVFDHRAVKMPFCRLRLSQFNLNNW